MRRIGPEVSRRRRGRLAVFAVATILGASITNTAVADASNLPSTDRGRVAQKGKLMFEAWVGYPECFYMPATCFSPMTPGYDIWVAEADGSGLTNVSNSPGLDWDASWSPDGTKIAFVSNRGGNLDTYVMDADGSDVQQITHSIGDDSYPTWSPSGRKIAVVDTSRRSPDIVVMRSDGTRRRRIASFRAIYELAWSPDGRRIAFTKEDHDGSADIFTIRPDGTGMRSVTDPNDDLDALGANWSPSGRRLVFDAVTCPPPPWSGCGNNWAIYSIRRDGSGLKQLTQKQHDVLTPDWSPDGTTIAYADESHAGGKSDIWLMNRDGSNQRVAFTKPDSYDWNVQWQPLP